MPHLRQSAQCESFDSLKKIENPNMQQQISTKVLTSSGIYKSVVVPHIFTQTRTQLPLYSIWNTPKLFEDRANNFFINAITRSFCYISQKRESCISRTCVCQLPPSNVCTLAQGTCSEIVMSTGGRWGSTLPLYMQSLHSQQIQLVHSQHILTCH